MRRDSAERRIFEDAAEDVLRQVAGDSSPAGEAMAVEARSLLDTFRSWRTSDPGPERLATIGKLLDLVGRARDHVGRRK